MSMITRKSPALYFHLRRIDLLPIKSYVGNHSYSPDFNQAKSSTLKADFFHHVF